jgi:hypothetical protein
LESTFQSLRSETPFTFPSAFTREEKSILINGLIWMEPAFMKQQIEEKKLAEGFSCVEAKVEL